MRQMKRKTVGLGLALVILGAGPSQAFQIDWEALDPPFDDTDTSGLQFFADVDGSAIDLTLTHSDNMWDNNSVPTIYDLGAGPPGPTPQIQRTLRLTNDQEGVIEPTHVTLTFSEAVLLDHFEIVSLSVIEGQWQEHVMVEAFDADGLPVPATIYGTNTLALVQGDTDGDAAYETAGLGSQELGQYGDAFFAYTETPVKSIRFSLRVTAPGGHENIFGFASVGISDIDFRVVVPEPGVALLLAPGLAGIALLRRRRMS